MPKDDLETQCMNELFNADSIEDKQMPLIHWRPVSLVDYEGNKIRDYTDEEKKEWLKREILRNKQTKQK